MNAPHSPPNQAQQMLWNTRAGDTWVAQQAMLDRLFSPFADLLATAVQASKARNVLDIGCGAGATSIATALALAPEGQCTGIDISVPLIAAARCRVESENINTAHFIASDAQIHDFAPGTFDAVISRFGVMFFDDPSAAFANLRRAARDDARLTMIVWRQAGENSFMIAAEHAARPFLPQLPIASPDEPGQFAFADPDKVRRILAGSWRDIEFKPIDISCTLSEDDLQTYIMSMGRVGTLLPDLDEKTRAIVCAALTDTFTQFVVDGTARFSLACWIVSARAE